jgi:uncharacterized membrane protein
MTPRSLCHSFAKNCLMKFINFMPVSYPITHQPLLMYLLHLLHVNAYFSSFIPVTIDDVYSLQFQSAETNCALDPIPTSNLKQCCQFQLPTITNVINLYFYWFSIAIFTCLWCAWGPVFFLLFILYTTLLVLSFRTVNTSMQMTLNSTCHSQQLVFLKTSLLETAISNSDVNEDTWGTLKFSALKTKAKDTN